MDVHLRGCQLALRLAFGVLASANPRRFTMVSWLAVIGYRSLVIGWLYCTCTTFLISSSFFIGMSIFDGVYFMQLMLKHGKAAMDDACVRLRSHTHTHLALP